MQNSKNSLVNLKTKLALVFAVVAGVIAIICSIRYNDFRIASVISFIIAVISLYIAYESDKKMETIGGVNFLGIVANFQRVRLTGSV